MRTWTTKLLSARPTLSTGQCCSLKVETDSQRVWLCRVYGGITVETYNAKAGRWEITEGSCSNKSPVTL